MSSSLPPDLAALLREIIARFPAGASLEQICNEMDPPAAQRTASTWLLALESAGEVEKIGAGRATRYRLRNPAQPDPTAGATGAPDPKPVDTPPARAADAAMPAEELSTAMMLLALPTIVAVQMYANAARFSLQQQALKNGLSVVEMKAYVERVMARLNTLTSAEAESYGLTPEQYARWRHDFSSH